MYLICCKWPSLFYICMHVALSEKRLNTSTLQQAAAAAAWIIWNGVEVEISSTWLLTGNVNNAVPATQPALTASFLSQILKDEHTLTVKAVIPPELDH